MRKLRPLRPAPRRLAQAGMTLIEIIIVIVLIGGVLAVVGGMIFKNRDKANFKLAGTQVQTIGHAVEQYNSDVGDYPRSLDDLVTDPKLNGWVGPYAKQKDLKDPFNHPLQYTVPGDGEPFDLYSYGKDGKEGGSSVDADVHYEH